MLGEDMYTQNKDKWQYEVAHWESTDEWRNALNGAASAFFFNPEGTPWAQHDVNQNKEES